MKTLIIKANNPNSGWTRHLNDLRRAMTWLMEIGVSLDNRNRYKKYEKEIDELSKIWHVNDLLEFEKSNKSKIINAFYETALLIYIWKVFKNSQVQNLADLLSISINGPSSHCLETSNSNNPRNFFFELIIAADFFGAGYPVSIGADKDDADIRITTDLFELIAECKRPQSKRGFLDTMKSGIDQLKFRIANTSSDCKGILFVSFDKLMNKELTMIDFTKKEEIADYFHAKSNTLIAPTLKNLNRSFGDSILAFVTDLRSPVNLITRNSRFSISRLSLFNTIGKISAQNKNFINVIFRNFSKAWNSKMMTA